MKKLLAALTISILPLLASCGQDASENGAQLNFSIAIPAPNSSAKTVAASATDICAEYAIDTITATVNDSAGKPVATSTWKCSDHGGSMTGLPSGSGFTLQLDGLSGTVKAWSATKSGIALSTSAPADAGTVALTYASSAAFTKAIVTLAATGATSSNQIISYGATVGIPVGVSLSADANGEPASGLLAKASTLSANSYIIGKYTAPTATTAGNIVLGAVDSAGFSGNLLTITTAIASGTTPPGASSFPVTSVTGYDLNGSQISGIGGSVTIRYQ